MEYKFIFAKYILDTPPGARVILYDAYVCSLPKNVHTSLRLIEEFSIPDVYISTKSLKHAYDRRPVSTVEHLDEIAVLFYEPDYITVNFGNQRADFIFFKQFRRNKFLACPVEICPYKNGTALFCATFFPSKSAYIKNPLSYGAGRAARFLHRNEISFEISPRSRADFLAFRSMR